MQLEFAQAMSDFKIMFPEMEVDVIEAVLRANSGAVDATIDALLQMSTDNHNEKLRHELDKSSNSEILQIKKNLIVNSSQIVDETLSSKSFNMPKRYENKKTNATVRLNADQKKWNPPVLGPLPPSFLRIAPAVDVSLDDEQFAVMLQNEEFMNELRWNQEFLSALETDKVQENPAFKERLRNMGKTSKKKFSQLARVFTWQRNKKPPQNSGLLQEEQSDEEESKGFKVKSN